jgi:hypothetical protein
MDATQNKPTFEEETKFLIEVLKEHNERERAKSELLWAEFAKLKAETEMLRQSLGKPSGL